MKNSLGRQRLVPYISYAAVQQMSSQAGHKAGLLSSAQDGGGFSVLTTSVDGGAVPPVPAVQSGIGIASV